MSKITALIPTFNEAHNIAAAIESVRFADEILVVDSYSTDATVTIANEMGARVIQREYENSASQKNWAIPQAKHPWIVLLDADEVLPSALQEEIVDKVKANPTEVGFWIYRSNDFMGQRIRYSGWQGDKVIRLFLRDKCRYQEKAVHSEIIAEGEVGFLTHKMLHNTYVGINAYLQKLQRYATWQAEDYDARTGKIGAYHLLIKPIFRIFKHYILKGGFRDGVPGLVVSVLSGHAVFSRYVKLWLRRRGLD